MRCWERRPPNAFMRFSCAKHYCKFQKVGVAVVVTCSRVTLDCRRDALSCRLPHDSQERRDDGRTGRERIERRQKREEGTKKGEEETERRCFARQLRRGKHRGEAHESTCCARKEGLSPCGAGGSAEMMHAASLICSLRSRQVERRESGGARAVTHCLP